MTTAEMMTDLHVMLLVQVLLQLAGCEEVHAGPTENVGRGEVWGVGGASTTFLHKLGCQLYVASAYNEPVTPITQGLAQQPLPSHLAKQQSGKIGPTILPGC